jgi:hypothetical protein
MDMRIVVSVTFAVFLSATTALRWQINLEGVLLLLYQETIKTPFGTRTAMIPQNALCPDNAPLLREAVRYRTSA